MNFFKTKILIFLIFILQFAQFGCKGVDGEKAGELRFFEVSKDAYNKVINDMDMPSEVNLSVEKSLSNQDYPIEVAVYRDGKWFYDLPRFGTGTGTWEIVDGKLHLFAKTRIFDMHIDIVGLDPEAKNFALKFRDRFGPQILKTEFSK